MFRHSLVLRTNEKKTNLLFVFFIYYFLFFFTVRLDFTGFITKLFVFVFSLSHLFTSFFGLNWKIEKNFL